VNCSLCSGDDYWCDREEVADSDYGLWRAIQMSGSEFPTCILIINIDSVTILRHDATSGDRIFSTDEGYR